MGLGLQGALGVVGAQDALRQRIKDQLLAEQQRQQMAIQQQELALRARQVGGQEEDRKAALAERIAEARLKITAGANTDLNAIPPTQPISAGTQQGMVARGVLPERFGAMGITPQEPPSALQAPDQAPASALPDTIANSPAPAARQFLRTRTPAEQQTFEDDAQVQQLANDPNTPPALKQFLRVRGALPKGENVPYQLITEPNGPQGTATDANYMLDGKPIVAIRRNGRLSYQGQDVTDQVTPYVPPPDAANARQAATIQAQIDAENRRQDFAEAQVGRKELTDNIEKPYRDTQASVETLRDTVRAAKAGNKVAGSLQSLETTMAAIRGQGLNRINTAEIGVTANAGSLYDRVAGWIGKADAGQPVPENVQKDMIAFADILEKAAYKKYTTGHAAVSKRYKLKDEEVMPPPNGMAAPPAPAGWKYVPTPGGGWTAVEAK